MEKQELRRKVIATGLTMLGLCVVLGAAIWLLLTSKVFNSVTQWLLVGCCVLLAAAIIGFFRNKMIEIRMLRTCLRTTSTPLGNVETGAVQSETTAGASLFATENTPTQLSGAASVRESIEFHAAPLNESFGFESAASEMQVQLPDFSAQPISFTADSPPEIAFQEPFVEAVAPLDAAPVEQVPQPSAPIAQPSAPIAQPSAPIAQPSAPIAQPSTPIAQPSAPIAQPSTPIAQPSAPIAQPSAPIAQPSAPIAQPSAPITQVPLTRVPTPIQPQVPVFQPVTQIPQPAAPLQRTSAPAPQPKAQQPIQQRPAQPQAQHPVAAAVPTDSDTPPVKLNVAPISWPGSPLPSRPRSATAQPDFSQIAPRPTAGAQQQGSISLADQQAALRAAHEKAAQEAAERSAREEAAQLAAQAASEAAQRAADAADRASARLREAAGLNDPTPAPIPQGAPAQDAWEKVSSDPISPVEATAL